MSYYITYAVTPKEKILTFRPDDDVYQAMEVLKASDGVPFSEQIRRALRTWLESRGVLKSERKRAFTRKRP